MPVIVSGPARARGANRRRIARRARAALDALGRERFELSVVLADDPTIRRLNREHRGIDRATDVLSFPISTDPEGDGSGLLGDVVISLETAARQAAEQGHSVEDEIDCLLVHGVLHLVGYDHERSPGEAARMRRKERELLGRIGSRTAAPLTNRPSRRSRGGRV